MQPISVHSDAIWLYEKYIRVSPREQPRRQFLCTQLPWNCLMDACSASFSIAVYPLALWSHWNAWESYIDAVLSSGISCRYRLAYWDRHDNRLQENQKSVEKAGMNLCFCTDMHGSSTKIITLNSMTAGRISVPQVHMTASTETVTQRKRAL